MKFDHVVVAVSDLEQSLPWYAAVLGAAGFSKTREHVWLNEAGQALDLKQALQPDHGYLRQGVGVNHLAFAAPSREDVERVRAEVRDAGFEVPEIQSFGETRALFLKDRDGMRIEIVHEPPAVA